MRSVMFMQVNLRMERSMSIGALRLSDGPMRGEKRIGVSAFLVKIEDLRGQAVTLPLTLTDRFSCLATVSGFKNPAA